MFAVKVVFMSGPDDGLEIWLKSEEKGRRSGHGWKFAIGRSETCDLVIPYDTQVSRTHAYICVDPSDLWIEDAGSRNGTFVGRHQIAKPYNLLLDELFRVGNTWLRIEELT